MFTSEQYLDQMSKRYGLLLQHGTRVAVRVGISERRGNIVGADNELQVRVQLDGRPLTYSFRPSDLRILANPRR